MRHFRFKISKLYLFFSLLISCLFSSYAQVLIKGKITDHKGNPVKAAKVIVQNLAHWPYEVVKAYSDERGNYSLIVYLMDHPGHTHPPLTEIPYRITAVAKGYSKSRIDITIPTGILNSKIPQFIKVNLKLKQLPQNFVQIEIYGRISDPVPHNRVDTALVSIVKARSVQNQYIVKAVGIKYFKSMPFLMAKFARSNIKVRPQDEKVKLDLKLQSLDRDKYYRLYSSTQFLGSDIDIGFEYNLFIEIPEEK